jgi:hypothetical protein
MITESYTEEDYKKLTDKLQNKTNKRQLIKEMARELYIQPEAGSLKHCVLYAKQFYDRIEAELDRALGGEE